MLRRNRGKLCRNHQGDFYLIAHGKSQPVQVLRLRLQTSTAAVSPRSCFNIPTSAFASLRFALKFNVLKGDSSKSHLAQRQVAVEVLAGQLCCKGSVLLGRAGFGFAQFADLDPSRRFSCACRDRKLLKGSLAGFFGLSGHTH